MGAPRRYRDFPLELRRWSPRGFELAVLPSFAGDGTTVEVQLADGELDADLLRLDRGKASMDDVIRLGQRLAGLILPEGDVRTLFRLALGTAKNEDARLRLRLLIRDGPLTVIPWELCYLQTNPGETSTRHFLALDPLVSVVRHPPLGEQPPSLEPVDPTRIRLVACTAQAAPYASLDLAKERRAIEQAFANVAVPGVEITRSLVPDATLGQLSEALSQRAELFHFGGHGVSESNEIDPASGRPIRQGSIVLRGEDGRARLVGAASLALELRRSGVRVALLGACDAGRQDGVSAWTGIAPALVEKGVAAVIGMQFRIADDIAIGFGETFYRELARGVSVDEAVSTARLAVYHINESGWQWAVPVLYTRAENTFVFPVGPSLGDAATIAPAAPAPPRVRGTRPLAFLAEVFDRAEEQLELGRQLADPTARVISVVGREGMGKSAVASVVLAGLEHDRWPSPETAVHVEGIAYFSARDPAFTLDRLYSECAGLLTDELATLLRRAWGNQTVPLGERIEQLLQELARGYRLIVIDDAEALLDQFGVFADVRVRSFFETVMSSPWSVNVLLISRVAASLGSRAHALSRVVEMAGGLPVDDAVAMLRATDPDNRLRIREAAEADVRDAVIRVSGVPRAIELIATILETQPLNSLEGVVSAFFKDEVVIRDLIEETYAGLDPQDRRVIEALAVYRGPVPMDAIPALLAPELPDLDPAAAILRLVRAHLVIADRAAQTVSASAIDQAYAYSRLPAEGPLSRQVMEARAADYFKARRAPARGWKRISDLDPQIREFEHRLRADDADGASEALSTIEQHMIWYGNVELARWLRARLEGRLTDPRQKAWHAYARGHVRIVLGPLSDSLVLFEEATRLAQAAPDERLAALALGWQAEANRRLGSLDEARAQFAVAIMGLGAFDDMAENVANLRLLDGLTAAYLGDGRAALEEGRWLLSGPPPSDKNQGRAHDCISLAHLVLGQLDEAAEHAQLAIEAYGRSDDRESLPYAQNVLGMVLALHGRFDEALGHFEQVERAGVEAQHPRISGLGLFNRARALRLLGQATKSLIIAREAETALTAVGAFESAPAASLRRALEVAARATSEDELDELLACARTSARSADLQPPHDLAREVAERAAELGSDDVAAQAASLLAELEARLV